MLVAEMATEGDASSARVRKRLIEGGHHLNPLPEGPSGGAAAGAGSAHHAGSGAHHTDGKGHKGKRPGAESHSGFRAGPFAIPAIPQAPPVPVDVQFTRYVYVCQCYFGQVAKIFLIIAHMYTSAFADGTCDHP